MADRPDYVLEISALGEGSPEAGAVAGGRPWIGVHFECCGVYSRIYRCAAGDAYEGRCPRCAGRLHVAVGPGGTTQRIFRAS